MSIIGNYLMVDENLIEQIKTGRIEIKPFFIEQIIIKTSISI